jgi:hypothetical protein
MKQLRHYGSLMLLGLLAFAACKKKNKGNGGAVPAETIEISTITWDGKEITPNTTGTKENPFMVSSAEVATSIAYTLKSGTAGTADVKQETTNLYTFTAIQGTASKAFYIQWTSTDKDVAVQVTYNGQNIQLSGTNNDTYAIEESSTTCFDEKQLQITRADDGTLIPFSALTTNVANKWTFTATPQAGADYAKTYTLTYTAATPDEYTLICTPQELKNIKNRLNGKYIQGKDIDLTSLENFEPIGVNNSKPFSGTYDGQNYKIIDLKVDANETGKYQYAGLFGFAKNATLQNIALDGGSVSSSSSSSSSYAGGLVGVANGTTISNSYATGAVSCSSSYAYAYAGGLVGEAYNSKITNSYATGNVSSSSSSSYAIAGGLVGYAYNTTISNSYATGAVSSSSSSSSYAIAGGLVGDAGYNTTISNSYATGAVSSSSSSSAYAGGLVGLDNNNTTITNCFQPNTGVTINGQTGQESNLPAGVTRISAAGQAQNAFTGWAFGTIWATFSGTDWPLLSWQKR